MFDYAGMLKACARDDRAALRTLYDQEAGRMISVAQRIVRRRELAEEVVQDAFMQIWRKAGSFDEELGSAQAWIYTILRNRALNLIRDGAREDLIDADALERTRDGDADIEDAFHRLSESSALRRCLEALEVEKRKSLLLSYVAGYSHGEIAAMLRVPVGTAKSWVRRGLLAIRDCMA
jgi:RNA polymerase sigma-70 factor, ECF subfamily